MIKITTTTFLLLLFSLCTLQAITPQKKIKLPLPTEAQLRWQNNEQIMFVHLSPAAWQNREYDNRSTPLDQIKLSKLDTDQWCEVAQSWGAKMILYVAKHCGGFCWWQTETSDYGIKNTPWKDGRGDVLKDLSESCKKYGLDLGIYVYPGDEHWGAGIGSGGITDDPTKQEAYNQLYRQQLTEVLTRYGLIREVWFDGNCHIPVNDILNKYATEAVVLQSKSASLRWVGNEDGYAPDPNWYTLRKEDMDSGVSTALHSDLNGDVYAPVEVDVPFLKNNGHKWFWAPETDHLLMSQEQLMSLYYKSVGRGSVLLMNSTPDTSGLIPASHVIVYKKFGEEINARFTHPLNQTHGTGYQFEMLFTKITSINHVILQEDLSKGQRVISYRIEGSIDGKTWTTLYIGNSIGNKKIDFFNTVQVQKIRVCILKAKDTPQIKKIAVYQINSTLSDFSNNGKNPIVVGYWEASTYTSEWKEVTFDLTSRMNAIGQYDISFSILAYDFASKEPCGLEFKDVKLEMYGKDMPEALVQLENKNIFRITRSQQTLEEFPIKLTLKIKSKPGKSSGEINIKRLTY